jgi:hypothetical protein
MKIEKIVCSVKYAEKLKKLGVKQNSIFYWIRTRELKHKNIVSNNFIEEHGMKKNYYSAFTIGELGYILNEYLEGWEITRYPRGWSLRQKKFVRRIWNNIREAMCLLDMFMHKKPLPKTEADARAKMVVYLLENKLLKVCDVNTAIRK